MHKLKAEFFLFLVSIVFSCHSQEFPKGSLVIVGGRLNYDNKSVFTQLSDLAGGPEKALFSITPSACGHTTQTFVYFSKGLISYGVNFVKIILLLSAIIAYLRFRKANYLELAELKVYLPILNDKK